MRNTFLAIILIVASSSYGEKTSDDPWKHINYWKQNYIHEGQEVELTLKRRTKTNVIDIDSIDQLKPGDGCSASYSYLKNGRKVPHGPSYQWKLNMTIEQIGMLDHGKLKYIHRFYPTGEIINTVQINKSKNQIETKWFAKNGTLLGKYIMNNKNSHQMTKEDNLYYWNGKKVSMKEYSKKIQPLMILSTK